MTLSNDGLDIPTKLQVGTNGGTLNQCNAFIAIINCNATLNVSGAASTETTNSTYGIHSLGVIAPGGTNNAGNANISSTLVLAGNQSFTANNSAISAAAANITSAGTVTELVGVGSFVIQGGAGSTVTNAYSLRAGIQQVDGTLTNAFGLQVQSTTGTITNNYGVQVQAQTSGANNYGIVVGAAGTQTLWVNDTSDSTDSAGGIAFGVSRDTNLYRSGANTLRTDDTFLSVRVGINATAFGTDEMLRVNTPTTTDNSAVVMFSSGATDQKVLVLQGLPAQVANLQEWQDSDGNALAFISSIGDLSVRNATVNGNLTVLGHILGFNNSGTTTVSAGAATGTGGGATINGSDVAGFVTIDTGTSASTGVLATITFANPYGGASLGPSVILTAVNGDASAIQYFVGSSTNNTFTINANDLPADSTQYRYYYQVIQFDDTN